GIIFIQVFITVGILLCLDQITLRYPQVCYSLVISGLVNTPVNFVKLLSLFNVRALCEKYSRNCPAALRKQVNLAQRPGGRGVLNVIQYTLRFYLHYINRYLQIRRRLLFCASSQNKATDNGCS